jgi:hypothetical protein
MANKAILFSEGCGEVGSHVSEVWTMPEELIVWVSASAWMPEEREKNT